MIDSCPALRSLAGGDTPCLVAVPSQLLLMLQWAQHRQLAPIPEVELITISGARWMRAHTPALRALFPKARIIEFYGASEASFVAWMDADEASGPQAVGRPFSNVELSIRPTGSDAAENAFPFRRIIDKPQPDMLNNRSSQSGKTLTALTAKQQYQRTKQQTGSQKYRQ